MRKRGLVTVTIAAAAMVVLAGGLMASNMGFKLNYPLAVTGTATGSQTIALPYNPQVGMTDAKGLFQDILAAGGVSNIQKFLKATDTFQLYTYGGVASGDNFTLNKGEGYFVKVGANFPYIIVGSHDPSASISLQLAGTATGSNLFAPPYHTTAATAQELFQEIGVASNVQRFLPATDTFQLYTYGGVASGDNFPIAPGVAYFVKMAADLPAYQPSHY